MTVTGDTGLRPLRPFTTTSTSTFGCIGTRHLVRGLGAAGLGHVDADEDEVPGLLVVVVPALEPGVVRHPVAGRAHAAAAHLVIG